MSTLPDRIARRALLARGFASRWIDTSVGRVHVMESKQSGALPPVVVLHGFGSAGVHYGRLVRRLAPDVRRVVAPDMPGHGFSDRPERLDAASLSAGLVEALDSVLDEPALVYGNSMGGLAAIRYALARRERVLGLVLSSPAGAAMADQELAGLRRTFDLRTQADALQFVDRLFAHKNAFRQFIAWGLKRNMNRPQFRSLISQVGEGDFLTGGELSDLGVPVLLMWGREERILPPSSLAFFREHLPEHAHIEEPPEFGHSPHLEHPWRVAKRVTSFLRQIERGARLESAATP